MRLLLLIFFLPLQMILLLLVSLTEPFRFLFHLFHRRKHVLNEFSRESCSLVMLNWNGLHLLKESIPALINAVEKDGREHQILVVDNGSNDESLDWLETNHPEVDILRLEKNLGFGTGNNLGVKAAKNEIVVLLNNDMIVRNDFLAPLLKGFKYPDVFAVTSQVFFPEEKRREETGATAAYFDKGYLHFTHLPIKESHFNRGYLPVLWAGGGSSAFRRSMFLELDGFSDIYSPCYQEDVDLSFRAWRKGWHSLLAADSNVLHKHRSTSSRLFSDKNLSAMVDERKLWFIWLNLEIKTLIPHFLLLPLSLSRWLPAGTYLKALRRLPMILFSRLGHPKRMYTDREILGWAKHPLLYLNRFRADRFPALEEPRKLRILIVSSYLPHLGTHGGAGRVFQLMKRAAEKHEITLIAYLEKEEDKQFLPQAESCCHRVETVFRGQFKHSSWFPYEPFEEFNCDSFRNSLEDMAAERDYDVVHFEWTQMAEFSDLFPYTPKIITEVEVNWAAHRTLVTVEPNPIKKIKKYYDSLQTLYREAEMCRKVDRVVCVTEDDKDYLKEYVSPEKLLVVNTGVDLDYFSYSEQGKDPKALVFVGAFRHSPNLDAMFYFHREIFPEIVKQCPETHLYIVGSSPPDGIKELGLRENITVTGFVEDIRDYYRLAQVVVVPIRTGVGIRGKVLEGWSAGSAMVASPLACQGIKAEHGRNIMVADNPVDFARFTIELLKNPEECANLARRGRSTAEALYGWDTMGTQMVEEYEYISGINKLTEQGKPVE
jgi:GT2 family glycosyltransferase/glycosyltransferase involved in cell wall biosynthesis